MISSAFAKETLVIISGGFGSCPTNGFLDFFVNAPKTRHMFQGFYRENIDVILRSETGKLPRYFATCYTGATDLLWNFTRHIEGRYSFDSENLIVGPNVKRFHIEQGPQFDSPKFLDEMKAKLTKRIKYYEKNNIDLDLYIIGHSYGGYTALELAKTYSKYIKGMVTIDPISMLNCQAKTMMVEFKDTVNKKHPGCLKAPDDRYSKKNIAFLQKHMSENKGKWWLHMHQNSFAWLHSTKIETGGTPFPKNIYVPEEDFSGIGPFTGNHHIEIAKQRFIWQIIAKQVKDSLNGED